ncbi:peptidoglycan D,D-transpeptidase FtsI family protein [Rubellicoccus peritrichatus]|uniref:Penicillin-binding transpeptidase domain-containing protein n=1 Tax=Rubellicoccus peritrichatus TaxID=3080537 RepID=A0AAQ3QWS0_9BACT|nr:penicillin-binding transpeptidase domain-containing protein [Puniceicoccus sp. CR14]WOO42135.1 penicillin-binding transpeptidase domain-containing protein [Puniceicoccus sp. CR14]
MGLVHHYRQWEPRLRLFYGVIAGMFLVLAIGLAWRQLIMRPEYKEKEDRQNMRRVIQPGPRGRILDRHGEVLVDNRPRFSAVVSLKDLRDEFEREYSKQLNEKREAHKASGSDKPFKFDWEELRWESRQAVLQKRLDKINEILGTDEELSVRDLQRHFWHRLLMPFPLFSDLTANQYAQLIEQLPLGSDVFIYTDTARSYPHNDAAAHTLGYVVSKRDLKQTDGLPGEDLKTFAYKGEIGRNGLERTFDEQLQGESGGEIWIVDRFQFQYDKPTLEKAAKQGEDLVTSLDINMQLAAEKALGDKTGAAVAVDVKTGEIMVLASKPAYNLNDLSPSIPQSVFNDIEARGAWLNRSVQGLYPPGSTFKMITAIAAMRNGDLEFDDILECGTHYRVGRRLFPEHSGRAFGNIALPYALQKSSNTFFYQTGLDTGIDNIANEARRFGLDEQTGIQLPFESNRMVVPDKAWKKETQGFGWVGGDTANVSIGQGYLLVTPLQMASFAASLARGETRTKLTLLHNPDRGVVDHGGEKIGLTKEEYGAIVQGMEAAVGWDGTARYAMIPGHRLAGKTGTAQVKKDGKPLTLAWFVGFAPVEDPQVAVAICVEGMVAGDNYAGGKTAAPIAKAIFEAYFDQLPSNEIVANLP